MEIPECQWQSNGIAQHRQPASHPPPFRLLHPVSPPRYLIKSFSIVGCPQGMDRMHGHQPREVVVVEG